MAEHLRLAKSLPDHRSVGDWAETETSRDIWRSLELVNTSNRPAITMIAGTPGVGKSETVKRFARHVGDTAVYVQVARGEGTAWSFAKALAAQWPGSTYFNTLFDARAILSDYIGEGRLLIVDEAQYLSQKNRRNGQTGEAYEWLRATSETGRFHIVFCGDLNLISAVSAMPQLQSRMMRPVIIREASREDVEAMVRGTAFESDRSIDALHAVARLKGGLRNVENVARIATMFAGDDIPTVSHLKAAITDMKLGQKGADYA